MFGFQVMGLCFFFFFFNDTATTEIYTLSLHDALPILPRPEKSVEGPTTSPPHNTTDYYEREEQSHPRAEKRMRLRRSRPTLRPKAGRHRPRRGRKRQARACPDNTADRLKVT